MLAEETVAASDGKWNDNSIAAFEIVDRFANLNYLSHEFVTENISFFHGWNKSIVQMQIRAANSRQGNADDSVSRINNSRVGYVFDVNILRTTPAYCLHGNSSRMFEKGDEKSHRFTMATAMRRFDLNVTPDGSRRVKQL